MIVARQGTSRIFLASWGNVVMESPAQLRLASLDESELFDNLDDVMGALGIDARGMQQIGYIDETNDGPTAGDAARPALEPPPVFEELHEGQARRQATAATTPAAQPEAGQGRPISTRLTAAGYPRIV